MKKSRDAFRTISEVAEWLDIPTHVLRFWESRFSQIKPVKRAGGRRYYRPSDMELIGGVKTLLHDEGMTIRGVQKLLREKGIRHVAGFSPPLEDTGETDTGNVIEHQPQPADVTFVSSPAARSTHAATPAPDVDDRDRAGTTDEVDDDQLDMFPDHPAAAEEGTNIDGPRKVHTEGEAIISEAPSVAEPSNHTAADTKSAVVIPDTPDVPKTDPADDDDATPAHPGIAARLALARPADLARHRDRLLAARDRLQALRVSAAE